MNIKSLITVDTVSTTITGNTKEEIIRSLIGILESTGKIRDIDEAFSRVMERERKMSTGLKNGIAVPHGKTDSVDSLLACVAIRKDGAEFNALDGKPSTIFIMTLSPRSQSGPHLQFLAEVSRLLENSTARERLVNAKTREDIVLVFSAMR